MKLFEYIARDNNTSAAAVDFHAAVKFNPFLTLEVFLF